MKALIYICAILAVLTISYNTRGVFTPGTVKADSVTDGKYDGDCQPNATVGRCADKCPMPTSEGTYYLQGYDKNTGAAVCGFSYYHPCPYADAQPADGEVCQKLTAEAQAPSQPAPAATDVNQTPQTVDIEAPVVNDFVGK